MASVLYLIREALVSSMVTPIGRRFSMIPTIVTAFSWHLVVIIARDIKLSIRIRVAPQNPKGL